MEEERGKKAKDMEGAREGKKSEKVGECEGNNHLFE